jgi:hypothetical protein
MKQYKLVLMLCSGCVVATLFFIFLILRKPMSHGARILSYKHYMPDNATHNATNRAPHMTSTDNRIARRVGLLLSLFAALVLSVPSGAADSPADASKPLVKGAPPVSLHLPPLGLRLRDMSVTERAELKLNQGIVVMVAVGASAIAGVREDDIILAVDKKPVTGTEQFWLLVDAAKWKCTLQILRKDKRIEVAIGEKDG